MERNEKLEKVWTEMIHDRKNIILNNESTTRSREDHLEWCKTRALEYIDRGDSRNAVLSFISDMSKHPETENNRALQILPLIINSSPMEVKKFIQGFN